VVVIVVVETVVAVVVLLVVVVVVTRQLSTNRLTCISYSTPFKAGATTDAHLLGSAAATYPKGGTTIISDESKADRVTFVSKA
jgi:hypothetical protein